MPYVHRRPVDVVAYSVTKAAAAVDIRPERIRAAVTDGALASYRVGTKSRILKSELERWISSHPSARRPREASHGA